MRRQRRERRIAGAGPGDVVVFRCSGVVTLSACDGPIVLSNSLDIDAGGQSVTISGGAALAAFVVNPGVTVTLSHLTISDSRAGAGQGGAVLNNGTLTLNGASITGDTGTFGGGVANNGTLYINDSSFTGNSGYSGGAIDNSGTLSVKSSSFTSNCAPSGGGIANSGTLIISDSTFNKDCADLGGVS